MKNLVILSLTSVLLGCSATKTTSNGSKVIVSPNQPPKKCRYLGQVVGNQGNMFSGGWTSNRNLEEGSMNDLRNKAADLGANYVQLITNRAGNTGGGGLNSAGYEQTNVTNLGNAYACPGSNFTDN